MVLTMRAGRWFFRRAAESGCLVIHDGIDGMPRPPGEGGERGPKTEKNGKQQPWKFAIYYDSVQVFPFFFSFPPLGINNMLMELSA